MAHVDEMQMMRERYGQMEESYQKMKKEREAEKAAVKQQAVASPGTTGARENEGSNSFVVVSDHQSASGTVNNESKAPAYLHQYDEV